MYNYALQHLTAVTVYPYFDCMSAPHIYACPPTTIHRELVDARARARVVCAMSHKYVYKALAQKFGIPSVSAFCHGWYGYVGVHQSIELYCIFADDCTRPVNRRRTANNGKSVGGVGVLFFVIAYVPPRYTMRLSQYLSSVLRVV